MSLTPRSYVPNPNLPYVWVRAAGEDITISPDGKPRRLTSFLYRRVSDGGNRVDISLFDEEWDSVEGALSRANNQIEFRYGYTEGGLLSPWQLATVISYEPSQIIDGVAITISAVSTMLVDDESLVKSRRFEEMDIHEIVSYIASEHGWGVDIDETETLWTRDDLRESVRVKMPFTQRKQRDLNFIREVLAPKSIRKKDKQSGYLLYLDDREKILHFHPPRFEISSSQVFIPRRDPLSEVISFSPDVNSLARLQMGAGVAGAPHINLYTGEYKETTADNSSTPEKTVLGGPITKASGASGEYYSAVEHRVILDGDHADVAARYRYFDNFNLVFGATLVIQGNPKYKVGEVFRIINITSRGSLHYTSGLYKVLVIEDRISDGEFTTSFDLVRNGHPSSDQVVGDEAIGSINQ